MKVTRIKNTKTGRTGWLFRFTSPITHRPTDKRVYASEFPVADKLFRQHMDELELEAVNLPSAARLKMPYDDLVSRFLNEAPITSEKRKEQLRCVLERNELRLGCARDLNDVNGLTVACKRLLEAKARNASYLLKLQAMLRQLSRWGFEAGILQTHPLSRWRKLPFKHSPWKRRAYTAQEVQQVLVAMADLDSSFGRKYPLEIVLRTLVTSGNRPGVMLRATVADLEDDRVKLPPGDGRKHNGAATLPPELIQELRVYTRKRGIGERLFLTADGNPVDLDNLCKRDFRLAAILAFVRQAWPQNDPTTEHAEPLEVAAAILSGCAHKFDGRAPTDPAKLERRAQKKAAIDGLAALLGPLVKSRLKGRDLYAFIRKTHITLARVAGVNRDAVAVQVGHAGDGVEEKFYLDERLTNPALSSKTVYELIAPARADTQTNVIRLAVGAENLEPHEVQSEVSGKKARNCNVRRRAESVASRVGIPASEWSHLWDLNPGPALYESAALPLS